MPDHSAPIFLPATFTTGHSKLAQNSQTHYDPVAETSHFGIRVWRSRRHSSRGLSRRQRATNWLLCLPTFGGPPKILDRCFGRRELSEMTVHQNNSLVAEGTRRRWQRVIRGRAVIGAEYRVLCAAQRWPLFLRQLGGLAKVDRPMKRMIHVPNAAAKSGHRMAAKGMHFP